MAYVGTSPRFPEVDLREQQIEAQREAVRQREGTSRYGLIMQQRRWEEEQKRKEQEWGLSRDAMSQMVKEYNRAYGEAATGEETRYQEMLDIAGQTTGQRASDIRSDYAGREASGLQRLARLGMANTTVGDTMGMGYEREKQSSLNRLADEMQQTQLGIRAGRDPRFPNQGLLAETSKQLGAGGTYTRAAAPLSGMRLF